MDLKPSNILLTRNLYIKICDFGESFAFADLNSEGQKFRPAKTPPYTPPEMFQENVLKFMHPKTDIFSFGAMISEIIFEKRIIEFKRINLTPYVKKLQSKTYKIFVVDRYYDKSGIKHLMLILKILMLMCVHPEPEKRPDIDWIIVILRVITNIIETNY